ncbi:MAG: thioredoxin domain-containing protein [Candidatus Omnitrophica bacterium]|nr:thioredoxin domain-containing protein [Candidatus Omnitrophota bacterium]
MVGIEGCVQKEKSVTEHVTGKPNRLIHEKSPYLLQHAYNPVDWYPWGEEAFEKAKKEDKPIFLSVGYSTCHWCHVMEKESFEDSEVAKIMNDHFVSIKVDREERPDVDNIYMSFVMAMSGSGGWPLNVFLTPDRKPFYGGTYFPPVEMWGRPSFKTLLLQIADAWKNQKGSLLESSNSLAEAFKEQSDRSSEKKFTLSEKTLEGGASQFASQYDGSYGGFGPAPKFPRSHTLSFLLRHWKRSGDPRALEMVEKTLQEMAKGGMYDHLGGGFHRYSTDGQWRIPHFEKMLYDQAILSRSYLEAYQVTKKQEYAATARDIFDYVLRDMQSPEGGFYSAEDADSAPDPKHPDEKSEGAFYLWKKEEILKILGEEKGKAFSYRYGIEEEGGVLYEAHPVEDALSEEKKKLFSERTKRLRPHLDDKILVDWNGLMISSLAFGAQVLENPRYEKAAREAADFILEKLIREDGRLLHRYREKEAAILGTLEDYAFFIHGLLDLYEASFEVRYLESAKRLCIQMRDLFWDDKEGGFFLTGDDAEKLLLRPKELYDGAIPSGNSVAVLDLLRLGRFTMERSFEEKAKQLFDTFSAQIAQSPMHFPQLLIALHFALGPSKEIVIAGEKEDPQTQAMLKTIYERFIPNKIVVLHPSGKEGKAIESLVPFVASQDPMDGKTTAYVCENYVCNLPTNDVKVLESLLEK